MKSDIQKQIDMKYDVDALYDVKNEIELENRLKRKPTLEEIVNSDNDSDQVIEVMWQLIKDLAKKVGELEGNLIDKGVV